MLKTPEARFFIKIFIFSVLLCTVFVYSVLWRLFYATGINPTYVIPSPILVALGVSIVFLLPVYIGASGLRFLFLKKRTTFLGKFVLALLVLLFWFLFFKLIGFKFFTLSEWMYISKWYTQYSSDIFAKQISFALLVLSIILALWICIMILGYSNTAKHGKKIWLLIKLCISPYMFMEHPGRNTDLYCSL